MQPAPVIEAPTEVPTDRPREVPLEETTAAPAGCANCGAPGLGAFCASCGQAQPKDGDYSLRDLIAAALVRLTDYDGRIWSTLRALFLNPGQLARDHFDGRRARYLTPLRVFMLGNLAAWFAVPFVGIRGFNLDWADYYLLFPDLWDDALALRASFSGTTVEALKARVHALGSAKDAAAVLTMVPLLALGLKLLLRGRGFGFVHHLVFTAHYYCLHLAAVVLIMGAGGINAVLWLKANPSPLGTEVFLPVLLNKWVQQFLVWPVLVPYAFFALRRAYSLSSREAAWRAALMVGWACTLLRSFFDIAFALVLISA